MSTRTPLRRPQGKLEQFRLGAEQWNQRMDRIARYRPLTVLGRSAEGAPHPFQVTPRWGPGGWTAQVEPGIVRGRAAVVQIPDPAHPEQMVEVSLLDAPAIPLSDIRPATEIPKWFTDRFNLGAANSDVVLDGDLGYRVVSDPLADAQRAAAKGKRRELYATGVRLVQARPTATLDTDEAGGFFVRMTGSVSEKARITVGQAALKDDADSSNLDLILGGIQDTGEDSIRIATVFFLSPENWSDTGAGVDATFRPYVQQAVHTNLKYDIALPTLPEKGLDISRLAAGLGAGGDVIAGMLENLQQQDSLLAALFSEVKVRGKFWSI